MSVRPIKFTLEQAQKAADDWGFNCGPGALCAILNLTPDELRPLLGNFEQKRYTNPSLMFDTLKRSGATYRQVYRGDEPDAGWPCFLTHGLVRVQWGGPWTKPGVPMRARYRQTHWIGARLNGGRAEIFDVNATCVGGWLSLREWGGKLVPWLCKQCVPKWDGTFWPTHVIEVQQ